MLVRLVDVKERTFWVNPTHVKMLQEDKKGHAEVVLSYGGGLGRNLTIKVDRPIDEVAEALNAGMPVVDLAPPGSFDDDGGGGDDGGAMIAAGMIG